MSIWTANRIVWTAPVRMEKYCVWTALRKFLNYFSDKEKVARPDGHGSCPDVRARDSIFDEI